MKGTASQISIEVDLRSKFPAIRDQGPRSTCLACAASDAHTQAHALLEPLSVEFLFYHAAQSMPGKDGAGGITFEAARDALQNPGQPLERAWPYQYTQPMPWVVPPVSRCWRAEADISTVVATRNIVGHLKTYQPVVLGIKLTAKFINPPSTGVVPAGANGFGGHAVLAVGLGRRRSGTVFFLIRNSWGKAWGKDGYAWLPSRYLTDKLIGTFTITAIA
jgi:hypothetical protein